MIEKEVYMSPSGYLIARNINIIFGSIYYAKHNLEEWYKKIDNNKNERVVNIHNNISLDHYIKNEKPYLISWNKSRIDSPIYDLLSFYKNHYLDFDFDDLFHFYESGYPLKEDERLLLFTYMAILLLYVVFCLLWANGVDIIEKIYYNSLALKRRRLFVWKIII